MDANYIFVPAIGIGFIAGLRSITAPAVVSWAAYLGWLGLGGSPLAFIGSAAAVAILSLLALGEYVADLLPTTPRRTAPAPLIARIITGMLSGACLCASANRSLLVGAMLGGTGGVIGAFSGYNVRKRLVHAQKVPDFVIALLEDVVTIAGGLMIMSQL